MALAGRWSIHVGGEIDDKLPLHGKVVVGFTQVFGDHLLTANVHINMLANFNVDDAEESLVLLFELLLVEDLNRNQAVIGDSDLECLVPVRVKGLFDNRRRMCLLTIDSQNGEGVRKSEDIALEQAIGRNHCDPQIPSPSISSHFVTLGKRLGSA